jgi:hypothetical protein
MRVTVGAGLLMLGASVACVKTGTVAERQPVASLAAYKTAALTVEAPPDLKNAERYKAGLSESLVARLTEKKVFERVAPGEGDVVIKVKITNVDTGSAAARAFMGANSGAAEVFATVELFDKQAKPIGAFDVTGNSKSNVQTKVNGVDASSVSDVTTKAVEAAAEEIALHLEKKR